MAFRLSLRLKYLSFYLLFLVVYALINYYPALRGYQALHAHYPGLAWIWLSIVFVGTGLLPGSRYLAKHLPHDAARLLMLLSNYWLGSIFYLFLMVLATDLIRLADRYFNLLPPAYKTPHPTIALVIILFIVLLQFYGTWNARNPIVKHYQLTLDKKSSKLDNLKVVMVSDIHLGWIVGLDRLNLLIEEINALNPDIVLLAGDVIDEGVDLTAEAGIPQAFRRLASRYGTFAVPGNHEYISRQVYRVGKYLDDAGVTVLRDRWIRLEDSLYLVGRDDLTRGRFTSVDRKDISDLMQGINREELPVLLMDHQPFNLDQPAQAGVDLQFSGHTHLGQFFPNNLITNAMYEQDWGYLRRESFQLIVSCGYGTWGPPIRIGNRPEIVAVAIEFK